MHPGSTRLWPLSLANTDLQRLAAIHENLRPAFIRLLEQEGIAPEPDMTALLAELYLPLADWLLQQSSTRPLLVGLNGAQGSGKTTLAKILASVLQRGFGCKLAVLSIDDFYLSREQRQQLAASIHPLLMTRGVPGTHDVALMQSVLSRLKQHTPDEIRVPVFDKAGDDRLPESQWRLIRAPVDMVIVEGWCVGAKAEADAALEQAINPLEREEDTDGRWRRYVNRRLAQDYQPLFDLLDVLLMLQAPSMEKIFDWRLLQERKLQSRHDPNRHSRIMSPAQLQRFIMHYERITRHCLQEMPTRADIVLRLNEAHHVDKVSCNHRP